MSNNDLNNITSIDQFFEICNEIKEEQEAAEKYYDNEVDAIKFNSIDLISTINQISKKGNKYAYHELHDIVKLNDKINALRLEIDEFNNRGRFFPIRIEKKEGAFCLIHEEGENYLVQYYSNSGFLLASLDEIYTDLDDALRVAKNGK